MQLRNYSDQKSKIRQRFEIGMVLYFWTRSSKLMIWIKIENVLTHKQKNRTERKQLIESESLGQKNFEKKHYRSSHNESGIEQVDALVRGKGDWLSENLENLVVEVQTECKHLSQAKTVQLQAVSLSNVTKNRHEMKIVDRE